MLKIISDKKLETLLKSMGLVIDLFDIDYNKGPQLTTTSLCDGKKFSYMGLDYTLYPSYYKDIDDFYTYLSRILGLDNSQEWLYYPRSVHQIDYSHHIVYTDDTTLACSMDANGIYHHVGWTRGRIEDQGPRGIHYQYIAEDSDMVLTPDWVEGRNSLYDYIKHPGNKKYWDTVRYPSIEVGYKGEKVWEYPSLSIYMVNLFSDKWFPVSFGADLEGYPEGVINEITMAKALLDI